MLSAASGRPTGTRRALATNFHGLEAAFPGPLLPRGSHSSSWRRLPGTCSATGPFANARGRGRNGRGRGTHGGRGSTGRGRGSGPGDPGWRRDGSTSDGAGYAASPLARFQQLSRFDDLRPHQAQAWARAATEVLDGGVGAQVEQVLEALGQGGAGDKGVRLYVEGVLAEATDPGAGTEALDPALAALRLREHLPQLLPVLGVLGHEALGSHLTARPWANSLFSAVRGCTNLHALALGLEELRAQSPRGPPVSQALPPYSSWLEVAGLLVALAVQLWQRLRSPDAAALRAACERLLAAAERLAAAEAGGAAVSGGGGVGGGGSRARRTLLAIRNARSMLGVGLAAPTTVNAKRPATPADLEAARPDSLPGSERPGGPRHGNDCDDFTQVQLQPPLEELLCRTRPYLPPNRADCVPDWLRGRGPAWARLDALFRLLRHDVTAPLAAAVQDMMDSGGLTAATAADRQGRRPASGPKAGPRSDLRCYRDVRLEGLADDCIRVSLQPPARLSTEAQVRHWWAASRALQAGTLLLLAWQPPGGAAEPQLVMAAVERRQEEMDRKTLRAVVDIRLERGSHGAVLDALITRAGPGQEVVLVQDRNSFFAYRPILKALQDMARSPLPLAEHLLPTEWPPSGPARPGLPAYLRDGAVYDLSSLTDTAKPDALGADEATRLAQQLRSVPLAAPSAFPTEALVASTSLDQAQAAALRAFLTQELAVIQGPPGTGKTYVSIQATRLLLANTTGGDQSKSATTIATSAFSPSPDGGPSPARGPLPAVGTVLVVTFTNHALDQYMEGLLGAGVQDMVRVGGNCRSERLQPYMLYSKVDRPHPGRAYFQAREALRDIQAELLGLLEETRAEATGAVTGPRAPQRRYSGRNERQHAPVSLTWPQLHKCRDVPPRLRASFARGLLPRNTAGVRDLVVDWLQGNPRSDHRLGRLAANASGFPMPEEEEGLEEDWEDEGESEDGEGGEEGGAGREQAEALEAVEEDPAAEVEAEAAPDVRAAGRQAEAALEELLVEGWAAEGQQEEGAEWEEEDLGGGGGVGSGGVLNEAALAAMVRGDRPLEKLLEAESVWEMSSTERWRLYRELRRLRLAALASEVEARQGELRAAVEAQNVEHDRLKLEELRKARVVGMTTTGLAGSQQLIRALAPKVVIVEEAAEVSEAHVLACLVPSVEHLVLIGDHEQLRPKVNTFELQAYSKKGYDLDVSLIERLVTSAFPVERLSQQRRMRPQIRALIQPIYPHLVDHPSVKAYPPVRGMVHPLFLWDHDRPDSGDSGEEAGSRSRSNPWEAQAAVLTARYLLQQGYKTDDIVILVPYVGQLLAVRRELQARSFLVAVSEADAEQIAREAGGSGGEEQESAANGAGQDGASAKEGGADASGSDEEPASGRKAGKKEKPAAAPAAEAQQGNRIRVATIDNFQGEEAKLVIVSVTASNPDAYIGFLKLRNRINVMLSRAQHGMYILANTSTLLHPDNVTRQPMWADVHGQLAAAGCVGRELPVRCERHGTVSLISQQLGDFEALVGDGGCNEPCGQPLPCGHTCTRRCHTDDPRHEHALCTKPCDRLHQPCLHPCDKLCHEDCGPCERVIAAHPLDCGHTAINVPCNQVTSHSIHCSAPTQLTMPQCGHVLTVPCDETQQRLADPSSCPQKVSVQLALCNHSVEVECGLRAEAALQPHRCRQPCGCTLPGCGHTCRGSCGGCSSGRLGTGALRSAFKGLAALGIQSSTDDEEQDPGPRAHTQTMLLGRRAPSRAAAKASALVAQAAATDRLPQLRQLVTQATEGHAQCREPCERNLACGHYCVASCHQGQPCPACTRECWIRCDHHRCLKGCGAPCTPCAEACKWECEHQGRCGAPCGAPCDRLPCDERCSKRLPCGHRCPGLCGEPCPSMDYCVHPDCATKTPARVAEQVVDAVMMTPFSGLSDAAVDADPLVALPCGHAYTASTLDAWLDMETRFYERAPPEGDRPGRWLGLRQLPTDQDIIKCCPDCREPIRGVRRYGRATHKAALDLIDRKAAAAAAASLQTAAQELRAQEAALGAWSLQGPGTDRRQQARARNQSAVENALRNVMNHAGGIAKAYLKLAKGLESGPKARTYEAAVSAVKRRMEAEAARVGEAVAAAAAATSAAGTEADGPAVAAAAPAAAAAAAAAAQRAGPSDRSRLEAAEAALFTLRGDWTAVWAARCGYLGAVAMQIRAAAKGLREYAQPVPNPNSFQWKREQDKRKEQVKQLLTGAGKLAAEAAAMAVPPPPSSKPSAKKPQKQQQQSWLAQAAERRDLGSAVRLAAALMALHLDHVAVLQAAKPHLGGGGGGGISGGGAQPGGGAGGGEGSKAGQPSPVEKLKRQQLELLDKVQALAAEAEAVPGASGLEAGAASSGAAAGGGEGPLEVVRRLAGKAAQWREQLMKDELREALEALERSELRLSGYYGGDGNLAGHLYRCANGHVYVVGECGGFNQNAHCPECGARIGSGSGDSRASLQDLLG